MADATLVDLVKITALTTGTGAVTLGDAVPGYRGREALLDGAVYGYSIQQEAEYEIGRCTYLLASTQIVRTPEFSSNGGPAINLQANASIAFVATAEDILGRDVLRPLYGYGAPTNNIGLIGQTYTDKNEPVTLYGPKTASGWGVGVVLSGTPGPPGNSNNTYTSYTALQASDPMRKYAYLSGDTDPNPRPDGPYSNTTGNVGEWMAQSAAGITARRPETGALLRSTDEVLAESFATPADFSTATNDDDLIDTLLASSAATIRIPRRDYTIARVHVVPAGKTVLIDGYTRFTWTAAAPADFTGMFNVGGPGVRIGVYGTGRAIFASATPQPILSAVLAQGVTDLDISGIQGENVGAVALTSGTGTVYASAVTPEMAWNDPSLTANVCQKVTIRDCGVKYATPNNYGIYLGYSFDVNVEGCDIDGAFQGIQWWGGDANPAADGAFANERKCQNVRITRCRVKNAVGGGIWGSMGRNVRVELCDVDGAEDVGFDLEGTINGTVIGCTSQHCHNGNYSTFFYCQNIQYIGCNSYQDNAAWPHYRSYNNAQNGIPAGVVIDGGTWETAKSAGMPGMIDAANGPNREITVRNIRGINTRISLKFNNLCRILVAGNELRIPYLSSAAFSAVEVDGAHQALTADGAIVQATQIIADNTITTDYAQPAGSIAVHIIAGDFNSIVSSEIRNNKFNSGAPWPVDIKFSSVTANPGTAPTCVITGNWLGTAGTGKEGIVYFNTGVAGVAYEGGNMNRYGAPLAA